MSQRISAVNATFGLTLKVEGDCHTKNLSKNVAALHEGQSYRNVLNCMIHEVTVTDHLKANPQRNQNTSKVQEINSENLFHHINPIRLFLYHFQLPIAYPKLCSRLCIYFTNSKNMQIHSCEQCFSMSNIWTSIT